MPLALVAGIVVVSAAAAAAFVVAGGGCRHVDDDHVGAGTVAGTAAVVDP